MAESPQPIPQLPLALQLAREATFETYLAEADNAGVAAHVRAVATGERRDAIWLAGGIGVGKTHLLQAACTAAGAAGRRAIYVPLGRHSELSPGLLGDLDALDLVALDAVDSVARNRDWETALFGVLTPRSAETASLLFASRDVPAKVAFDLPDLASRAAGMIVYRLVGLSDEAQIGALLRHAEQRGVGLDRAAAEFLAHRVARDMSTLCHWLDRLDAASLAAKRQITIPLIRAVLQYREDRDTR